ncbi:PilZ domain-containing protein [Hoeflea sp. AS60]|uniref:PilZ domain-containing protein n=1 Tax=Hoeflea sp. AS60 TaxID=3135780 RepID=UPI0031725379
MVNSHEPNDPTGEANPGDHRASRSKVLKGAHAAFNHEFSAIPCTLRDVSATGARVIFEGGWFVPDRFTLHVDIDGYKIECERVWQKGSECGVRFVGEKIITGKARQQVLTPEPPSDNIATVTAPAPIFRDQARPLAPKRPQLGGFGRRTR